MRNETLISDLREQAWVLYQREDHFTSKLLIDAIHTIEDQEITINQFVEWQNGSLKQVQENVDHFLKSLLGDENANS